jgi:polyhydroxyalkanoate synthase subunit PhaC
VNPPGEQSRSSYRVAEEHPDDAEAWLASAATLRGSWWPDYARWLGERSGDLIPAPARLGSRRHRATAKAPGTYVHAS